MMKGKYFVIGAVLIYLLLIILFFKFRESKVFMNESAGDITVRFCCRDEENCKDNFIRENFKANITRYDEDEMVEMGEAYEIINGKSTCEMLEVREKWEFFYVSDYDVRLTKYFITKSFKTFKDGEVKIDDVLYPIDKYCLEDSIVDNVLQWNLLICQSNIFLRKSLHFVGELSQLILNF